MTERKQHPFQQFYRARMEKASRLYEATSPADAENLALGQRYKIILPEIGSEPIYTNDFNTAVGLAQEYGDKSEVIDLEQAAAGAADPTDPAAVGAPATEPQGMDAVVPEILPNELGERARAAAMAKKTEAQAARKALVKEAASFDDSVASPEADARMQELMGMSVDEFLAEYPDPNVRALAQQWYDAVHAGKQVEISGVGDVYEYGALGTQMVGPDAGDAGEPTPVPPAEMAVDFLVAAADTGARVLGEAAPAIGGGSSDAPRKRIAEATATALAGQTVGGKALKLVKEADEMEDDQFYVAVDTAGAPAEIKVDGDQTFIGPFASPEAAADAVGAPDACVVDGSGSPVSGGEGCEAGADPAADSEELEDLIPMEARIKTPTRESIHATVLADLRKESGDESLEIDTTITSGTQATDDASGALSTKGVNDGRTNQTPQDAGGSTATDNAAKPTDMPGDPAATLASQDKGAIVTNDGDLSGAGDGKGTAKFEGSVGYKRGNFVKVFEAKSRAKIDSGNVDSVDLDKGTVTLEGGVTYDLSGHYVEKVR
jgi:hypothetical protein